MKIYKEILVRNPLYMTTIDNGVTLLVFEGYAEGSDGKRYRCVEREVDEDEFEFVGWVQEK